MLEPFFATLLVWFQCRLKLEYRLLQRKKPALQSRRGSHFSAECGVHALADIKCRIRKGDKEQLEKKMDTKLARLTPPCTAPCPVYQPHPNPSSPTPFSRPPSVAVTLYRLKVKRRGYFYKNNRDRGVFNPRQKSPH